MALAAGCKDRSDEPVDGWEEVKEELLGARGGKSDPEDARSRNCFLRRPAYCIRDEEVLNEIVQPILDEHHGGEMPDKRGGVKKVVRRARSAYRDYTRTADGMKRVEELLQERYDDPRVETKGGTVTADVGFLPFTPGAGSHGGFRVHSSEVIDDGEWASEAIGKKLQEVVKEHQDAKIIHLVARIPDHFPRTNSLRGEPIHVWHRVGSKRIVTADRDVRTKARYIAELPDEGLAAVAAGKVSLKRDDLTPCYPPRRQSKAGHRTRCTP